MEWLKNHSTDAVDPVVQAAIKYLREDEGIEHIGGVGYCFGGKVSQSLPCAIPIQPINKNKTLLLLDLILLRYSLVCRPFPQEQQRYRSWLHCTSFICCHRGTRSYQRTALYRCCRLVLPYCLRQEIFLPASTDILSGTETDEIFTTPLRHKSEEILKTTGQAYQINLFSGVEHGFAVRSDLSVKQNKFAKEQAFIQAITWFEHHL